MACYRLAEVGETVAVPAPDLLVPLVSTAHDMRLFVVVLVAPPILRRLTRRRQRLSRSAAA